MTQLEELARACWTNDDDALDELLGVSQNSRYINDYFTSNDDTFGDDYFEATNTTVLHAACYKSKYGIFCRLLDKGSDPEQADGSGEAPIHAASASGVDAVLKVQHLIQINPASVNVKNRAGITPLFDACGYGQADVAELLIKHGAQHDVTDVDGNLALHDACGSQVAAVVKVQLLLDCNSDYVNRQNNDRDTPLHIASDRSSHDLVRYLLKRGARADILNSDQDLALHKACASELDACAKVRTLVAIDAAHVNATTQNDVTPLHIASQSGSYELVSLLLESGADVDARDADGELPLHLACQSAVDATRKVRRLLRVDTSHVNTTSAAARTPLYHACAAANLDVVQLLLERGAQCDVTDSDNRMPREYVKLPCSQYVNHEREHEAEKTGLKPLEIFLKVRGRFNADFVTSDHMLLHASTELVPTLLEALLRHGVAVNTTDGNGNTALHYATKHDRSENVKRLLLWHSDVNKRNNQGDTAVHLASRAGKRNSVKTLMSHPKYDMNVHNRAKETAVDVARSSPVTATFLEFEASAFTRASERITYLQSMVTRLRQIKLELGSTNKKICDVHSQIYTLDRDLRKRQHSHANQDANDLATDDVIAQLVRFQATLSDTMNAIEGDVKQLARDRNYFKTSNWANPFVARKIEGLADRADVISARAQTVLDRLHFMLQILQLSSYGAYKPSLLLVT